VTRLRARAGLPGVLLAVVALAAAAPPACAEDRERPFSLTVYLQQAFPKQTNTNEQIESINNQLGTDFETWDDVANLSLGVQLFRRVSRWWHVGVEWDFSRGGISGSGTVPTMVGPAHVEFRQEYSVYTDLLAVAHFLPCPDCRRATPFVLLGAGVGYEHDTTTLTIKADYLDQWLKVENSGSFPVYTIGVGVELPMSINGSTYLELGGAYYWGRLDHMVTAEGPLAPAPEVRADNDTTGPNYWLGFGCRF
jgi:hypothetical protein